MSFSLSQIWHGVVMFGSLKVGDIFDSFDDVQHKIKEIEDATAVQLHQRETLAASIMRHPGLARPRPS